MARTSPVLLATTGLAVLLIIVPIGFLIFGMFWTGFPGGPGQLTGEYLQEVFTTSSNLILLYNTLAFAAGSSLMTIGLATAIAWIVQRTDTPGRRLFDVLPLITFMFPSMLGDIAWTFLLSPTAGLINISIRTLFGLSEPPFNIYGLGGMIWSQGLSLTPLAYLLIAGAFTNMDPALEEAARASGASSTRSLFKITLPLVYPSILSTFALMFMIGVNSFETPTFIGLPGRVDVFMTSIFLKIAVDIPPSYGAGSALSFVFLLLSSAVVTFYLMSTRRLRKYAVITGKGYRPRPIRLGRWKYAALAFLVGYVVVALVLPLLTILLISFVPFYSPVGRNPFESLTLDNYGTILKDPILLRSALNSFVISLGAGLLTTFTAAILSYMAVRSRIRGRRIVEAVSILPIAYPGLVFSLALVWTALILFRPIYGSIWILILAYVVVFLPYAMRAITNSMMQIHNELEEAGWISGATWLTTLRRIILPLLKPALVNTIVLVLIQGYRQLGAAVILITPETMVLPVVILHWWTSGLLVNLSAAVMIYGGLLVVIIMIARYGFKANLTF